MLHQLQVFEHWVLLRLLQCGVGLVLQWQLFQPELPLSLHAAQPTLADRAAALTAAADQSSLPASAASRQTVSTLATSTAITSHATLAASSDVASAAMQHDARPGRRDR